MEIEPNNVKALYRRGLSYLSAGEPAAALNDFNRVREIEPDNKAALNQATICKQSIKDYNTKQKQLYANMFTKFASADKQVRFPSEINS